MAQFYLSRVAFVNQTPRQEDFGVIDFLCFLGKENGKMVLAENSFYVQVKANDEEILFKGDSCKWIADKMDLPLSICIADKRTNRIQIYTTWRVWFAFLMVRTLPVAEIKFYPGEIRFGDQVFGYSNVSQRLDVSLGNPILDIDFEKVEESYELSYKILKFWLDLDRVNTIGMRVHQAFVRGSGGWTANQIPSGLETYYGFGFPSRIIENSTSEHLLSLCVIYKHVGQHDKVFKIIELLKILPIEHQNSFRKYFVDGEYFEELKRMGITPPQ